MRNVYNRQYSSPHILDAARNSPQLCGDQIFRRSAAPVSSSQLGDLWLQFIWGDPAQPR